MEIIETILFCLPQAFKGTMYRIGKPPGLIAERITSGIIDDSRGKISWGLPANSEYNSPGKPWAEYRDQPGRPLEVMSWCVEKQKSWTVEDPGNTTRSVRLQVEGVPEDFFHMEPVLVPKTDLKLDSHLSFDYPRDCHGNSLWKNTEYIVVGVIKIHFHPFALKMDSHETRVIKKLSRSLGTELLSYQLRHDSMKTTERLAKNRLHACNILADALRNVITKSGLIFSLVKHEIGYIRDEWEKVLLAERREKNMKVEAITALNEILKGLGEGYEGLKGKLLHAQNKFLQLSLPPEKGEHWVIVQIEDRWRDLLHQCPLDNLKQKMILQTIDTLKKSLHFGKQPDSIANCDKIPEELKREWIGLIYRNNDCFNPSTLERLIKILGNSDLKIPSREKSKKTLIRLKALAETMSELEGKTNFLLRQILNGHDDAFVAESTNTITPDSSGKDQCLTSLFQPL